MPTHQQSEEFFQQLFPGFTNEEMENFLGNTLKEDEEGVPTLRAPDGSLDEFPTGALTELCRRIPDYLSMFGSSDLLAKWLTELASTGNGTEHPLVMALYAELQERGEQRLTTEGIDRVAHASPQQPSR